MTAPDPHGPRRAQRPERDVTLQAWASGHGAVYQAFGDVVVVHHDHFHAAAEEYGRTTGPSSIDECPYPGLRPFEMTDSAWFFGREKLVGRLVDRLEKCLSDRLPLAVVAPSGAGKSSLLRAGLLPAVAHGRLPGSQRWPQLLFTPSDAPLAALVSALARLTDEEETDVHEALSQGGEALAALIRTRLNLDRRSRLLLVVDQLEELFTLCPDPAARRRFVDALHGLAGGDEPAALVVYALRSDAYGDCAAHPFLADGLVHRQVIVGPMTEDEVRRTMTRPAERSRLKLAPGLVDVILRDLRATTRVDDQSYETSRLPLLAHALRATWQQRRDDTLTVDSYQDTGGIAEAVQATAEDEFTRLDDADHQAVRQMFLALVRTGENGEVSRRRRSRADLLLAMSRPERLPELVRRFTAARLLTQGVERGEATVEITHEALLRAWPRLRGWIAEAGSGALTRQAAEETAVAWERGGRQDAGLLYAGGRLEAATAWAQDTGPEEVGPLLAAFLAASRRQERRTRLVRKGAVVTVVVLAVVASALAVFSSQQRELAVRQRNDAIFSRVAAEADRRRDADPALAAQLDLVAHDMRPTPEGRTRLIRASGTVLPTALPGAHGVVHSTAFREDGTLLTGTDRVRLWDVGPDAAAKVLGTSPSPGPGIRVAAAYDARGALAAVGSGDGTFRLVDVSDPRRPVPLSAWTQAGAGAVPVLSFSPDGRTLALGTKDQRDGVTRGTVQLWDVGDPRRPRRVSTVLSLRGQHVGSVAFSPVGATLAVGGGTAPRSSLLRLWDVSDPARPAALGGSLGGHTTIVNRVAFNSTGNLMASAASDRKVYLWDTSDPGEPKQVQHLILGSEATALAFGPDWRLLATGENSGDVNLWNVAAPAFARPVAPTLRGHTSTLTQLAFDADGRTLVSGSGDGRIQVWRIPGTLVVTDHGAWVAAVALSGDGRLLAAASGAWVSLWDVSDRRRPARVGTLPQFPGTVSALSFRPGPSDRPLLATGEVAGRVRLWDVAAPAHPRRVSEAPGALPHQVGGLVFDAQGHTLIATAMGYERGFDGGVRAWAVTDPSRPTALHNAHLAARTPPLRGVAAAPAGGHVYTGDTVSGRLRVWRTGPGTAPVPVRGTAGGQMVMALAADPRGRLLVTGSGESLVRFWDVSDPLSPVAAGAPSRAGGPVFSVGFSTDGRLAAAGNSIGEIRLWDTTDPARTAGYGLPVSGHRGTVRSLVFTPHDGTLISGGEDGTLRLWQTDPDAARAVVCAATRFAMTPERWKEHVSTALPYAPPCRR
ncbi:AAA family ATPase [Streptomyces kanasensis]|uniref:nSTAND1 domain-containing NTPase n=1 Tax=Streptomyces kanasensis TaxID=936756 RepID=UPI0036F74C9F